MALGLVDTSARPDTPEGRANREKQIARAPAELAAIVEELLAAGAEAERDRIKSVSEQSMPGHEALIRQLQAGHPLDGIDQCHDRNLDLAGRECLEQAIHLCLEQAEFDLA